MSLKFFFNRKGAIVLNLTWLAWLLYLGQLWSLKPVLNGKWEPHGKLTVIAFLIHVVLAALITVTRFWPWYSKKDRGAGIEEHFEKTMVPVAYILILTNIIFPLWQNCWPYLLFTYLVFGVILIVNLIFIHFHLRDKDPLAPSYFQRNLHLALGTPRHKI